MITSMTGFGRAEHSINGIQATVEIKTLNSRYLDISPRMPHVLNNKELRVKEVIQHYLSRGKVNINVNIDKSATNTPSITYNKELLRSYSKMLDEMKFTAGVQEPVQLRDFFKFDELFETRKEDHEMIAVMWSCTEKALQAALENLNEMRRQEGRELEKDLRVQIDDILGLLDKVTDQSDKRAPEIREKLHQRIQKLVSDEHFNPDRMEMEVALLVDKMDINEEVVRLQSHLKFFLEALDNDETVGRRLNFLCQEINRELNTIGSKASDSDIAHHVVIAKEKLEQIREQVQNIE
ncbi:MAG: YicC/YloC family endoribonuclease [Balneolaceae bacterium]